MIQCIQRLNAGIGNSQRNTRIFVQIVNNANNGPMLYLMLVANKGQPVTNPQFQASGCYIAQDQGIRFICGEPMAR